MERFVYKYFELKYWRTVDKIIKLIITLERNKYCQSQRIF
jgi:hypothetical protein